MRYEDDPAGAWDALERRYAGKTIYHIDALNNALRNLEYTAGVAKLVADAYGIWQQLEAAGKVYTDSEIVMDILRALPHTFDPVRTSLRRPGISFEEAEMILLDWEGVLKERMGKEVTTAMYGQQQHSKGGHRKGVCYECGSNLHYKKKCPKWLAKQAEKEVAGVAVVEERPRVREVHEVAF
jgi:hypothetical protein